MVTRSERQEAVAAQHVPHFLLDSREAHEAARFAFEVVDNAGQGLEVQPATTVRAVIKVLLV